MLKKDKKEGTKQPWPLVVGRRHRMDTDVAGSKVCKCIRFHERSIYENVPGLCSGF